MIYKVYRKIFFSCLLLALAVGCSSDKRPVYRNLPFEFAIHYNADWEKKESYGAAVVAFLSPSEDKFDSFQENLTISIEDLDNRVSLEDYSKSVVDQLKLMGDLPDVYLDILESKKIMHRWVPGYKIVYTLTQYGYPEELVERDLAPSIDPEGFTVQIMMTFFIKNQRAYILTFVAPKEQYDQYYPDAESMIKTFKIY
ncbi:MAG: hypothetical protein PHY73_05275 [Candidatus Omnitrophica bacterium]|nr:hypothetical protein [Candidatus Omnitrophota bacterium]